jgi:hypothetical protein
VKIKYILYLAGFSICSCKPEEMPLPKGVWVNYNLDKIEFFNESIILGYGFAIPPDTLSYKIVGDSVEVVPTQVYGDATDAFTLKFTYKLAEDSLIIRSRQKNGYFARGELLNTYIAGNKIFIDHEWDSLIQYKYAHDVQYTDYPHLEKAVITKQGIFFLQTKLVDSLSRGIVEAEINEPTKTKIENEISQIDSSSFHLLRSEVPDTYMLHVIVYKDGLPIEFFGYDWPMIYMDTREFLCCTYKNLTFTD